MQSTPGTQRLVPVALAIAITFVSGLLHGQMSQRWGYGEEMEQAAQQLNWFPDRIGDWEQDSTFELSKSAIELLECRGYIHRGYRHRETGDFIKLAIMVGPGSKMSIHIPEICFEASNFTLLEPRRRYDIQVDDQQHAFWGVLFQLNDVSQRKLRVLYGWSRGEAWVAPKFPRWTVAGSPVLYKLQLSYSMNEAMFHDQELGEARVTQFLHDAISILQPASQPAEIKSASHAP